LTHIDNTCLGRAVAADYKLQNSIEHLKFLVVET